MTEKQFYKLDEYQGKLPNPRLFPIKGALVTAVEDCPNIFTDSFMMDIEVSKEERQRLEKRIERRVSKQSCNGILKQGKRTTILLSEPQYIFAGQQYTAYVLFAPGIKPVGIQVKYYRYFRHRYPNCNFYTDGEIWSVKSVKVKDKLVGLWTPVILPPVEET